MCYRTLLLLVQTRVNPGGLHKPCAHKDPDIKRVHFYSTTDKEKSTISIILPVKSHKCRFIGRNQSHALTLNILNQSS